MRYHYEKPNLYSSIFGNVYNCDHPVYDSCTLYLIGKRGLAVIQQRYDDITKKTWWAEIDPWLIDPLYLHPKFKNFLTIVQVRMRTVYIQRRQSDKLCGP